MRLLVEEVVVYVVGFSLTIIGMLGGALYWLGSKFREIDDRFRRIDERFQRIDERFQQIDNRFQQADKKIDEVFQQIEKELDDRFQQIIRRIDRLSEAFAGYQEFFIEFLASEGVIKAEKAEVVKGEVRRVMRLAAMANPLTKEEWERLGQLLDKGVDEMTYEEALELRELARKVVKEYGEYVEAWKLHIYASIMVGLTARKKAEKLGQEKQA